MSGIVAILSFDDTPVDQSWLSEAVELMRFRGPDAQRIWVDDRGGPVGLGHALLRSTGESEHESQPATLDGQVWITADVRLDARAELIERLRGQQRAVRGDAPDVELMLHAYHAWGEDFVRYCVGDFAVVLWDGVRQRLVCARDRFGVVPFYYARTKHGLVCSNTLDCIRRHPHVSNALNDLAIADHLIFGGNQEWDTTNFADIRRLPPAHTLTCANGSVQVAPYWTLPRQAEYLRYRRAEEYVEHFQDLFDLATADRLRTDRAGILMSGGLDSTSVAASAKRVLSATGRPYELRAYTWVYERIMRDEERHYAGLAATALDIPVQFLVADDHMFDPEPDADGGPRSPLQHVATYAHVMLSGLGGDPALYPDRRYWIGLLERGQLWRMLGDIRAHRRTHGRLPPFYIRPNVGRWLGRPVWRPPYPGWLQADFAERLHLRRRLEQVTEERLSDRGRTGMTAPFWSNLLNTRDPDHTRVAVRMRHPFFDLRVIRYLMAVPPIPWFVDKYLLRAAFKGVLPDAVRLRPKTLMTSWPHHALALQHGVPAWMEGLATTPELGRYVDLEALWEGLHAPARMLDYEYQGLVRALSLATWLRRNGLTSAIPTTHSARA